MKRWVSNNCTSIACADPSGRLSPGMYCADSLCNAALIGFPGTGKTPAVDVIRRALNRIDRNWMAEIERLRLAHDTKVEIAKAKLFVSPCLYVNDVTIERLAALLEVQPQGITFVADELARLFLNMQRSTTASTRILIGVLGWRALQDRAPKPAVDLSPASPGRHPVVASSRTG